MSSPDLILSAVATLIWEHSLPGTSLKLKLGGKHQCISISSGWIHPSPSEPSISLTFFQVSLILNKHTHPDFRQSIFASSHIHTLHTQDPRTRSTHTALFRILQTYTSHVQKHNSPARNPYAQFAEAAQAFQKQTHFTNKLYQNIRGHV